MFWYFFGIEIFKLSRENSFPFFPKALSYSNKITSFRQFIPMCVSFNHCICNVKHYRCKLAFCVIVVTKLIRPSRFDFKFKKITAPPVSNTRWHHILISIKIYHYTLSILMYKNYTKRILLLILIVVSVNIPLTGQLKY